MLFGLTLIALEKALPSRAAEDESHAVASLCPCFLASPGAANPQQSDPVIAGQQWRLAAAADTSGQRSGRDEEWNTKKATDLVRERSYATEQGQKVTGWRKPKPNE